MLTHSCLSSGFVSDISPTFWVSEALISCKNNKNYGFLARMIILFVLLRYRNRRYGNMYYDKACRYEIF